MDTNSVIQKIFDTETVVGQSGKTHQLHSAIDREKGEFLYNIIRKDSGVRRTLEVGCAYGLSSLYICSALDKRPDASHTIVDPFQKDHWDGVGVKNLDDAGVNFYDLVELRSEFALPELLQRRAGQFDFIFIDGHHTFDHTLLDCFYANRLLRVGGYLAIDDLKLLSVRRAVEFIKSYPCYRVHGMVARKRRLKKKNAIKRRLMAPVPQRVWSRVLSPERFRKIFVDRIERMIALQKIKEDVRGWDWHDDRFCNFYGS